VTGPPPSSRRPRLTQGLLLVCGFTLALALARPLQAMAQDEVQTRRAHIGVQLLRTMLASDLDLASKVAADRRLKLLLVYQHDAGAAESYAEELRQSGRGEEKGRVRDWPIDVEITADAVALTRRSPAPAAIYVVEPLSDEQLQALVAYGVQNRIIVFSSVEGHVERGVAGGLDIGVRALPYVNSQTLQDSQLRLKELFLKIAKRHG